MKRWVVVSAVMAVVVSLSVGLSFHGRTALMGIAHAEDEVDREGLDNWMLIVKGEPIEDLIRRREDMREVLLEVLGAYSDDELAGLLETAKKDDVRAADLPEALAGISGFSVLQLLEEYLASLDERERRVREHPVRGKIHRYHFNDTDKSGKLEVETEIESLRDDGTVGTDTYYWTITVISEGFEVRESEWQWPDPDNPDVPLLQGAPQFQPFPGTLDLPTAAFEGIWQRRLRYKLWAAGEKIRVDKIEKILENGNREELLQDHLWYKSNPNSCIDLMFKDYPPEYELPPQPAYCLGRCKHPMVVNTV